MIDLFFQFLKACDSLFWGYIGFVLIISLGLYLTIKNRFFQIRQVPLVAKTFFQFLGHSTSDGRGVHPLKAFFASAGGMIGIGNIVGVVTAIQMGGPGALLWLWVAGAIGSIIKYSEIYLGLKYRVENPQGGYDGGPMYFLRKAFKSPLLPTLMAVFLCIYGVEIYQFTVITDSVANNWHLPHVLVSIVLLSLVLYAALGGVKRTGQISSWIMPVFMLTYLCMGLWIIFSEIHILPAILKEVFVSAFTGHAAVGGFAGSSMILAVQHGIARAAYSADIGIGYDSIIQSESSTVFPERQARLAILGVFLDNMICTLSMILVLISGVWQSEVPIEGSLLVQVALSHYFPGMDIFMPIFLIICGYTTLIAFFCVGLKSASYLSPKRGRRYFTLLAILALLFFTFFDERQALVIMSVTGSLLLIINLIGIFKLRKEIVFQEMPQVVESQSIQKTA